MNEELELAIQEIRLRGNTPWFIPILLSGEVPDIKIGATRSLRDLQYVSLDAHGWRAGIDAISRRIGLPDLAAGDGVSAGARSLNSGDDRLPKATKLRQRLSIVMIAAVATVGLTIAIQFVLSIDTQKASKIPLEPRTNVENAFLPDGMRGAESDTPLVIAPQPDSKDFLLTARLVDEEHFDYYRLEIVDYSSGRVIWSQKKPQLGPDGIFSIFVPGPYLRPGKYALRVLGMLGDREASLATYTLRVVSPPGK